MARTVYKLGVTKTALTLAEHGAGIVTGHTRWENGKAYILVKAVAAGVVDGGACMSVTGAAVANTSVNADITVQVTTGNQTATVCANNTGAAVPANNYFWGIQIGRGYALAAGVLDTDGVELMSGAGGIIQVLAGAANSNVGVGITDTAAGVVNAVYWSLPSKRAAA